MRERFEGYTGKLAESEVLGETATSEIEKRERLEGYATYRQAVDLVKDSQPFTDPSDPEKRFPRDVHATLAKSLGLNDFSQLHYYTAVGSILDKLHGVDAFFELDLGDGKRVAITLDITQNPHKSGGYKADVILHWPREGISHKDPEDRAVWQEKVDELSRLILDVLKRKINLNELHSLTEAELQKSRQISEGERRGRIHRLEGVSKLNYAS